MADSREIKIIIGGDASGANRAFKETTASADKLSQSTKGVGESTSLAALGMAALSAGAAGALIILDKVAGAIGSIVSGLFKLITANQDWANTVDSIQDLTGATAEYASIVAHVGEIAGVERYRVVGAGRNRIEGGDAGCGGFVAAVRELAAPRGAAGALLRRAHLD